MSELECPSQSFSFAGDTNPAILRSPVVSPTTFSGLADRQANDRVTPSTCSSPDKNTMPLLVYLTELTGILSMAMHDDTGQRLTGNVTITMKSTDVRRHLASLGRVMTALATSETTTAPKVKLIVPPESVDPDSFCRAAATLDVSKIRLIMSASQVNVKDINSYAKILVACQHEYRRKHQLLLAPPNIINGIYTPSDQDAIKFVDDNDLISTIFSPELTDDQYFHALRAFTHESATGGRTSSKLLSAIGKYAMKTETYRSSYGNGESYSYSKNQIFHYLDEDNIYEQSMSMGVNKLIILGPDYYNSDKEIVLQTTYAIFGVFYFLQGIDGLNYLSNHFKWKASFSSAW